MAPLMLQVISSSIFFISWWVTKYQVVESMPTKFHTSCQDYWSVHLLVCRVYSRSQYFMLETNLLIGWHQILVTSPARISKGVGREIENIIMLVYVIDDKKNTTIVKRPKYKNLKRLKSHMSYMMSNKNKKFQDVQKTWIHLHTLYL